MGRRRKVFLALMICVLTVVLVVPVTVFSANGTTEVVSTESAGTSYFPSLAVDSDGNVHVAWDDLSDYGGSGTDRDIFYKAKVAGGWTTTEVVSTESAGTSYFPSLAVDSSGNVHVAWEDHSDYGGSGTDRDIFYKAKVAGDWTTTEVVSTESIGSSYDPCLVVDPSGNVHVAWHDLSDYGGSGTDHDIFYKMKVAGGWTTTEVVSTESAGTSWDPSLVVDSSGNVHVAWDDLSDYGGSGTDRDIFYKELVHDVAITNVTLSKTTATSGETVSINVTAKNNGTFKKTFTVTAYANTTIIDTKTVTNLTSGASKNLTFTWSTTGLDAGTYEIKADASVVAGETRTADNTVTDSFTLTPITSSISISISATTIQIGESITISGSISPPREGVNVTIEYRINGDWTTIDTVTTNDNGEYTHDWQPAESGTYYLKASWEGDTRTTSAESTERTVQIEAPATFPIEFLAAAIVGIVVVATVLVYLKKRKPKARAFMSIQLIL